jgi:hypothetical protein
MNIVSSQLRRCKENSNSRPAGRRAVSPEVPAGTGVSVSSGVHSNGSSSALGSLEDFVSGNKKSLLKHLKDQIKDSVLNKRYSLHDVVCKLMTDPFFNSPDDQSLIDSGKLPSVCKCQKTPLLGGTDSAFVPVYKNIETGKTHFGGLLSCGSVWMCPICSEKIAQGRAVELQESFDTWRSLDPDNNFQLMITFTIPHYSDDSLSGLYKLFMKARRNLKKQDILKRPSKICGKHINVFSQIRDDYKINGLVACLEPTWGVNGWHPHSHDVFYTSRPEFKSTNGHLLESLKAELTEAWLHACNRAGVKIKNKQHFRDHSIHIRKAPTPAEYISKWGIVDFEAHKDQLKKWGAAQELTKAHIKRSRGDKGLSPWDMLRLIQQFPEDRGIYLRFGRLWREFVSVMSGKNQIWWEKGFKAFLSEKSAKFSELSSLEDQDLAEAESGTKQLLGTFTSKEWKIILHKKIRGQVLYLAGLVPFEDVRLFVYQDNIINKKLVANE